MDTAKQYSFSYCGISCEEFGLHYIPNAKSRSFDQADYTEISETVTGRAGANWFGNTVKKLDFTLECYYEDLPESKIEAISRWMHKDTYGELRFSDRPWCYYMTRPTKKPTGERYPVYDMSGNQVYSGKLSLTLSCFESYARMDFQNITDRDIPSITALTGYVPDSQMPTLETNTGTQIIYNPGTETTNIVKITINGSAPNGLTIGNYTTGDVCKLISIPESGLVLNSETGTVTYADSGNYAYSYHNYGYITLAGCGQFRRDIFVQINSGSAVVRADDAVFYKDIDVGKYMYVDGAWHKIIYVQDGSHAVLNEALSITKSTTAMIAQMNEFYITGENVTLDTLTVEYVPLIR